MVMPEGQHILDFGKDLPKDKPGAVLDKLTNDQKALLLGAGLSARIMLAERSFKKFLEFVSVSEPPPGRGLISFEFWSHLEEVCDILEKDRLLVWLKARQTGASWLLAAYALWMAMYHETAVVLLLSQGEDEAKQLLAKTRFVYEHLPNDLRVPLGTDSRQQMEFPSQNSRISALPSTEKAGRSSTASLVIMDEADFHEHLEANYNAVKPTIDDVGGKLILVSTSNPLKMRSLFKDTYQTAPHNGFTRVFYGWNVRPNRDNAWYAQQRLEYADPSLFEKEYPATDDEALAPPRTIACFNHDILHMMRQDCKQPAYVMQCGLGEARIYQDFHPGKRYVAATDTSGGTGNDAAVTVIIDITTGYVVADIVDSLLPPDQIVLASSSLLGRYHNPVWAIESNSSGILAIAAAQSIRYPNLFYRDDDKPGWLTDERNRWLLWGELNEAVSSRLITIPNEDGLAEFYSVIRNPDKDGRIEAQSGAHDDYPTAVGIAWQMRKLARPIGRNTMMQERETWAGVLGRKSTHSRW